MLTIRRGTTAPEVETWRQTLAAGTKPSTWSNVRGQRRTWPAEWCWPLEAGEHFDERVEAATEAWQYVRGLEADGIVGPKTWGAAGRPSLVPEHAPLLFGTDISAIQGVLTRATWEALRDMGIRFNIFRSIVGNETWIDSAFRENERIANDLGMVCTRYLFAYPLRHIDPAKQVEDWLRRLESNGSDIGTLPLALDLEWPPREEWKTNADGSRTLHYPWRDKWNLDASFIRDWGCKALERGRELSGRDWLCYSYRYFLSCIEAERAPELGRSPLWLADYTHKGRFPNPAQVAAYKVPAPWTEIAIVQHDGNGGMVLPNGRDADFNVMTGGEARLRSLSGRATAPVEPVPQGPTPDDIIAFRRPLLGALVDDAVAEYRRSRIEAAIDAA